ncbi:MAG: hypothetical protein IKN86_02245 [Bacteroidaceae bacterium]|nr:hypothetical protein [Bacteroidaceae bacterium]
MDDQTKRDFMNDILAHVGMGGIGQVVLEQNNTFNVGKELPPQMPSYLMKEWTMGLYQFLVEKEFIDKQTPADDFLYLMGVTSIAPMKLKPINWLKTIQQLRLVLELSFKTPLHRGSLKKAEIERRAPYCFLNKGKKMEELSKPKTEWSPEIDDIETFFRQNPT